MTKSEWIKTRKESAKGNIQCISYTFEKLKSDICEGKCFDDDGMRADVEERLEDLIDGLRVLWVNVLMLDECSWYESLPEKQDIEPDKTGH